MNAFSKWALQNNKKDRHRCQWSWPWCITPPRARSRLCRRHVCGSRFKLCRGEDCLQCQYSIAPADDLLMTNGWNEPEEPLMGNQSCVVKCKIDIWGQLMHCGSQVCLVSLFSVSPQRYIDFISFFFSLSHPDRVRKGEGLVFRKILPQPQGGCSEHDREFRLM